MPSNTNRRLRDVRDQFSRVPHRRPSHAVLVGNPGTEAVKSHVQGIARHRDGYLLTHSNIEGDAGCLLVIDRRHRGRTVSLPAGSIDGAVLNHPGGCQLIGDYLAVPFEAVEKNVSRVAFFDVSRPEEPMELTVPAPIERRDRKAGAAGAANLTIDGTEYWFLAIYDNGRVDLFRSDGRAFPDTAFTLLYSKTIPDGYESFCLVADEANRLFAVGFRLDSRKQDKADLYRVHLDAPHLELLQSRRFLPHAIRSVHFRWGASIDVRSSDHLDILCTGRNFLLLPFVEREGEAPRESGGSSADAAGGTPVAEAGPIRRHCHVNTFSAR